MIEVCLSRPRRIKETAPLQESTPTAVAPFSRKQCPEARPTTAATSSPKPCLDSRTLFDTLFKSYPKAAVFSVVLGYHVPVASPTSDPEPELPLSLISLFSSKYTSCTTSQVLRLSEFKLPALTCSQQQADFLEASTHGQSSSVVWFEHRIGRITASVMGGVSKCKETAYPYSLVNSIMQYSKPPSNVPALK